MESLRGRLLIASPTLQDPNFARSVVLIAEHTAEGAMGVVLNRPMELEVAEASPVLAALGTDDEHVFAGGPVQPNGVMVLAEFSPPAEPAVTIAERLGFVGAEDDLEAVADTVLRARVFAGHAGWAAGQLDSELEDEGWIVADLDPEDPFTDDPLALWSIVLERLGGSFALVARMPEDPSVN
ncbi:MAG: YqgE/AlgH family protein [Solirubrobacteraceae bacterium]|nr:YqgE/AlgH family protein [Solirubrobacteraceae bacterium]